MSTNYADRAFNDYGGGDNGQRARAAILVHKTQSARLEAYKQKLWDPTHYADKAYQDLGGGDASSPAQRAYEAVMAQPAPRRHLFYRGKTWLALKSKAVSQQQSVPKPSVSAITFEKTPNNEKFWGCQIPGTDARSSTGDRKSVEALCAEKATCVGYYDGGPWFIATDHEPALCPAEKKGKEVYPHFYRKKVFVQTPNEIGVWGCQIPGTDSRSSTNVQKDVEALCMGNAACKGYYGNDVGSWFIATDKEPAACPAESRHATQKYPFFYKKGV
jgi:hypothetical protein